jgi:protein O-mannosyl-transferase
VSSACPPHVPSCNPGCPGRTLAVFLALFAGALALYARTAGFGFVNYDDGAYVFDNPHVTGGLSLDNALWAFRSGHAANWHPVTWLSHMLDCTCFGVHPGPQHLVSACFHAANGSLLFLALFRLTGALGRSAFVAALFAFHPVHVESAAWIAERKDVLSAFFSFLTLLAYASYAGRPAWRRYLLLALFFALALLSKPMAVTLPGVLFLLDYWPLQRLASLSQAPRLLLEKLPLLALSVASAVVTVAVQKSGGAVASLETFSFSARVANALLSYVRYLRMLFWPGNLMVEYDYDDAGFTFPAVAAAALLLLLTVAALRCGRRWKYLPVGWFWYLGTLAPVIGLLQVGSQAAADRYTYVPSIGVFLLVAWSGADALSRCRWPRAALPCLCAAALAACATLTWKQLAFWKNSQTRMALT